MAFFSCSDSPDGASRVDRAATPGEEIPEPPPSPAPTASETRTPSERNEVLRFAAIGDFGQGTAGQVQVAARMCSWHQTHPFDLVVTTGDNIYPTGSPEYFEDRFFDIYECLFGEGVVFRASLGNHDWTTEEGRYEIEEPRFGMPAADYVVREGGVRFVIANSNDLDREWLESALDPAPADRWTIVVMHHPVYSPGLHGSTPDFADLPALFEEHGVDLVLSGHDHLYAVTKPQNGLRYVVTGGGGANLYPCVPAYFSDVCEVRYHFLFVEATQRLIEVQAVGVSGTPFDRFTTRGLAGTAQS